MARHMTTEGKRAQTKKKIRVNKKRIIYLICVCIFIYSFLQIIMWTSSNIKMNKQEKQLVKEIIREEQVTENGEKINKIDFEKLKQINNEAVAWIEIPNTNINYPILQSKDNEYYLKKDIYKKYNSGGSIFMDCQNSNTFTDNNTVIFGHNLHLGKMFSELQKIVKNELGTDITIKIYLENKEKEYKVFSSYYSEPIKDPINSNVKNTRQFIKNAKEKSQIDFNINPNEQDRLLTLSTCDNSGKKRILVHCVEVIEREVKEKQNE